MSYRPITFSETRPHLSWKYNKVKNRRSFTEHHPINRIVCSSGGIKMNSFGYKT